MIAAMWLMTTTAMAQLCAPSEPAEERPVITYTSEAMAVDFAGGLRTVVKGELKREGELIPTLYYTYPSYTGCDKMINSIRVEVTRRRGERSSLTSVDPAKVEQSTETIGFRPEDEKMTHFIGFIHLTSGDWDSIEVKAIEGSAEIIRKADYKNKLIDEKK